MVKEPRPGRVKTRLARDIGPVAAAWWFRHQTNALLRRCRDARWHVVLAVAPDYAGRMSRAWPIDLTRVGQGSGNLGARMNRLFREMPPGPVVIIGADIPEIRRCHIERAFRALGGHDAVFGPATDGGYWMIGLRRTAAIPHHLFQDIRWSTKHALHDTMRNIPDARIALTDTLRDVDTLADLAALSR